MPSASIKLRFKTEQAIDPTLESAEGELPLRKWSIRLVQILQGEEVPAQCIDRVEYHLHETFENPVRTLSKPDFKLKEQGWGEFQLLVKIHFKEKQKAWKGTHLLSFADPAYDDDFAVKFDSCPESFSRLVKHLPLQSAADYSSDEDRKPAAKRLKEDHDEGFAKKKAKPKEVKKQLHGVDLQKLATYLEALSEKDADQVNILVEKHKSAGVYHRVTEDGELLLDLATLDAGLMKQLWEFAKSKAKAN